MGAGLPTRPAGALTERPGRVVLFSAGFSSRRVVATLEVDTGGRKGAGIDWQPGSARLFITELGEEDRDEVNIIRRGGNYGRPEVAGRDDGGGRHVPAAWDTGEGNIAPSGGTFVHRGGSTWTGSFVFGTLRGENVVRLKVSGARVLGGERVFEDRFGRIRNVVEGLDGALYLLTRIGTGEATRRARTTASSGS